MLNITSSLENDINTVRLDGEIDASTSIKFDQAIHDAINNHQNILIDFEKLEYISSAGLGVFMSYLNEIEDKKITLVLFGMHEKVHHVFQILGLDKLFTIVRSSTEARSKIGKS